MNAPKLDPRSLLIVVLCLSTIVLAVQDIYYLLGSGIITIAVALLFGVNFWRLIKRFRRFIYLLLTISLVQSICTPDTHVLLSVFSINVFTAKGVLLGIKTFMRLLVIFTSASIMTTINYRDTVQGLVQWKVPHMIAFMVSIALRFLPIFSEELRDSLTALQLRGVNLKKIPFGKKIKVYVYLLTPVVMSVLKRAQNLSMAMEARAFGAYPTRVSYLVLKLRAGDYLVQSLSLAFSAAYITSSFVFPFFYQ
ncbi:MAG: energy-coupling factor transporter transmembrane component T family protein [Bacillota bacterium]